MPNSLHKIELIAKEALMHLEHESVMTNAVHTDVSQDFAKLGDTVNARRPVQYKPQENNLDITGVRQDVIQGTVPVKMDKTATVPVQIGVLESSLLFDRFSEDIIKPAVIAIKDQVEESIAQTYSDFYNFTGTPGTTPSTLLELGEMGKVLTDSGVPMSGRLAFHGTDASLELVNGLKGVFVQDIAKTALENASFGRYANFQNYETAHAPLHTVGNYGGAPLVNGANQSVTYDTVKDTMEQVLQTDGWTANRVGLLNKGDVFTIAGVNAVSGVNGKDTGRLQNFVVKSTTDSVGGGVAAITISPPIIADPTSAYRTVTAAPADNAAITVKSGVAQSMHHQSMLLQPKSIAFVTRKLDIYKGAGVKTSTQSGNKFTISVTEFTSGDTLAHTLRFDVLYNAVVIDARLGGRLTN